MNSNMPPGVEPYMIPGNDEDNTVEVPENIDAIDEWAGKFTLPDDAEQVDYLAQVLAFMHCDVDLGAELNQKVLDLFDDVYAFLHDRADEAHQEAMERRVEAGL